MISVFKVVTCWIIFLDVMLFLKKQYFSHNSSDLTICCFKKVLSSAGTNSKDVIGGSTKVLYGITQYSTIRASLIVETHKL